MPRYTMSTQSAVGFIRVHQGLTLVQIKAPRVHIFREFGYW